MGKKFVEQSLVAAPTSGPKGRTPAIGEDVRMNDAEPVILWPTRDDDHDVQETGPPRQIRRRLVPDMAGRTDRMPEERRRPLKHCESGIL